MCRGRTADLFQDIIRTQVKLLCAREVERALIALGEVVKGLRLAAFDIRLVRDLMRFNEELWFEVK